jgi:hypothetical protein
MTNEEGAPQTITQECSRRLQTALEPYPRAERQLALKDRMLPPESSSRTHKLQPHGRAVKTPHNQRQPPTPTPFPIGGNARFFRYWRQARLPSDGLPIWSLPAHWGLRSSVHLTHHSRRQHIELNQCVFLWLCAGGVATDGDLPTRCCRQLAHHDGHLHGRHDPLGQMHAVTTVIKMATMVVPDRS